jgi:hypothetical protein
LRMTLCCRLFRVWETRREPRLDPPHFRAKLIGRALDQPATMSMDITIKNSPTILQAQDTSFASIQLRSSI